MHSATVDRDFNANESPKANRGSYIPFHNNYEVSEKFRKFTIHFDNFSLFTGCSSSLPTCGVASHQFGPDYGTAGYEKDYHRCVQGTCQRFTCVRFLSIRWQHGGLCQGVFDARGPIRHFPIASQENWIQKNPDF